MDNQNVQALLTPVEMERADALTIQAGTPGTELMQTAGQAVCNVLMKRFDPCAVLVVCGPGNNGGDGYVIARLLQAAGWPVTVASIEGARPAHGDAAFHARLWEGELHALSATLLEGTGLVVDALFGAGLQRPLEGVAATFASALNQRSIPVCAVDLPSGVNGATGQVMEVAIKTDICVTFFRKKPGHVLVPGRLFCGEVIVADIGIPARVLDTLVPDTFENAPVLWLRDFPWPTVQGHKYHRGHVLVVGGQTMTGAARLAARAAARIGAGLVTVAAPVFAWPVYAAALEGIMVTPFTDMASLQDIYSDARKNVVVVGPGAGVGGQTRDQVLGALATGRRVVLDADALTSFATRPEVLLGSLNHECVLTPHEGEFSRLFGLENCDRLARVREASRQSGAVVVLKGPDTVIAAPDGRVVINTNAPPWLATGGTGDVLTGLIAGLMSQGMTPFDAACAAVWVHGQAATDFGPGLVSEDLPGRVPEVLHYLYGERPR